MTKPKWKKLQRTAAILASVYSQSSIDIEQLVCMERQIGTGDGGLGVGGTQDTYTHTHTQPFDMDMGRKPG